MSDTRGVTVSEEAPEPAGAYPYARRAACAQMSASLIPCPLSTSRKHEYFY